jgi:type I restriction enzyme M protein
MSEELIQKGLTKGGIKVGIYEYYPIGSTTLNQLKKYRIIPKQDYKEYGTRRPDGLLVDRRNKNHVKVVVVTEYKDLDKFVSDEDKKGTIEQCNDICQILSAEVGIATDLLSFAWFNPQHPNPLTEYKDQTTNALRSYTIIQNENGDDFIKEFVIDQRQDEQELTKLNAKTRKSIQNLELVRKSITSTNSKLIKEVTIDPTSLAKQIWQDVWSVTGATPEKCLYTFVELFIFKYLSDLGILTEDGNGNKINFRDVYALGPNKAFKNYTQNARPFLRVMFPESPTDHTTIINGTVLNPNVPQHSTVFYKILKRFNDFGEMKNIDPRFKSKVFEEFMKETISRKNWGQFFTPRNIIDAMVEMSDIDKLEEGAEVCDPACGVGGYILEPMKVKDNGIDFYYQIEGNTIKSRLKFSGFDKGFEKEEQLVIILAKSNMLIFLSELLKKNPTLSEKFSELFNSTFQLLSTSILGTLSITEYDKYDLILTNPPYVTSGSSNYKDSINSDSTLREFYKTQGTGAESLFLEWIINSLKPSRSAFIMIPDGILNRLSDNKMRSFIKEECILDGIISLPANAFYRNPKKTYILAITKKPGKTSISRKEKKQTEPVFTYLVSNIGETLDVKRFPIDENDLNEMVSLYNQFKGAKSSFHTESKRCKIQPIKKFDTKKATSHWSVDRWWSTEEKVALGIEEEEPAVGLDEFREMLGNFVTKLNQEHEMLLKLADNKLLITRARTEVSLADTRYFDLFIGERVLRSEIFGIKEGIPIYSANVSKPFGYLPTSNITDFGHSYILWGIDGEFNFNVIPKGTQFATTDHCGAIRILDDRILPEYLIFELRLHAHLLGYDRTLRPSITKMKKVTVSIPINATGQFDTSAQSALIAKYEAIKNIQDTIMTETTILTSLHVK